MLATPATIDDPLAEIARAADTLNQMEIADLGPTGEPTADDRTIWDFDHGAVSTHVARKDEFLEQLAENVNAVVIHGVFEAGLALHGALACTTDPRAKRLIEEAIATLDETIRKTRSTFFDRGQGET